MMLKKQLMIGKSIYMFFIYEFIFYFHVEGKTITLKMKSTCIKNYSEVNIVTVP